MKKQPQHARKQQQAKNSVPPTTISARLKTLLQGLRNKQEKTK